MGRIRPIGPIGLILLSALATGGAAEVTWDTIIRLTTNPASQVTGYSGQRSVAVDGAGDVHVAWQDQRNVPYQTWYRRYDAATSTWQAETVLTNQKANCYPPSIACDSAGNVHLAWHVGDWNSLGVGIWAKRYNSGTHHWRADTLIDSTTTSYPQQYPSVACVPSTGDVAVAWYGSPDTGMNYQVFLKEWYPATGWDSAMQVSEAATNHDQVSVAAGANGDRAVVWVGKDFGDGSYQVYCRRRVGGAWQGVERVSDIPLGLSQYAPCVAFDLENAVHVAWHGLNGGYYQVFHRMRGDGGWSNIDSISGTRPYQQQLASIACDAAGRCHAVWCSQAGGTHYQLVYGQRDTDGVWSAPAILTGLDSGDVSHPSIACEEDSGIHIVWYDGHSGNQDVYYLHGAMPGSSGIESRPPLLSHSYTRSATIVRGMLVLGAVGSRQNTGYRAAPSDGGRCGQLLDAAGRRVLELRAGANDVRALAPGVYFVRGGGGMSEQGGAGTRKVVIQR